ncbi:MAG: RNA-binding protein [Methylococcales bacterium]|nr:RNA-binding protein [Methylococcales bacterium]
MNIYVGNLWRQTNEDTLRQMFLAYGDVNEVNIVKDRYTGESRGFGFVMMISDEASQNAIESLNGTELDGRVLTVNKARPKEKQEQNRSDGFRRYGQRPGNRNTLKPSSRW